MQLIKKSFRPYLNLLENIFYNHDNIIKHSKAVAQLVAEICNKLNLHVEVKERAIKLAILHDIGKLRWIEKKKKNILISDYEASQFILSQLVEPSPEMKYIFYLKKYLDYDFLNSASIMSFPIETLVVCYADLQIIENKVVSFDERKKYVFNRYFKDTIREDEFSDFWMKRSVFCQRFKDFLLNNNFVKSDRNYYELLSYNTGGWLYGNEYTFLQFLAKKALITQLDFVEVGSWRGKSTILLAGVLKEQQSSNLLYCVDNWKGGTDDDCLRLANNVNIFYEFQNNTQSLFRYIKPIIGLSTERETLKKLPPKIGLLFLDGAHDYETIKEEITLYKELLDRNGIICFHDTDNPNYPGVRNAIREFITTDEFRFLGQESYIAAYQKK